MAKKPLKRTVQSAKKRGTVSRSAVRKAVKTARKKSVAKSK